MTIKWPEAGGRRESVAVATPVIFNMLSTREALAESIGSCQLCLNLRFQLKPWAPVVGVEPGRPMSHHRESYLVGPRRPTVADPRGRGPCQARRVTEAVGADARGLGARIHRAGIAQAAGGFRPNSRGVSPLRPGCWGPSVGKKACRRQRPKLSAEAEPTRWFRS